MFLRLIVFARLIRSHHHRHHHLADLELCYLLNRSGLTYPEVSLTVSPAIFSPLVCCCFSIPSNLLRDIPSICCKHFLLSSCILFKTGLVLIPFAIPVILSWSVLLYPAVLLTHFLRSYSNTPVRELSAQCTCSHCYWSGFTFSRVLCGLTNSSSQSLHDPLV
jgi:hypothetical protein